MNIFLSWSGKRSQKAAEAFYDWLPDVLQTVRPWFSTQDIGSGAGWNQEIRNALRESNFGIIFVTRDNQEKPWLMFEAGAIAKHVEEARVIPLIVDDELKPEMLTGPLGQLQSRVATEDNIFKLLVDLNASSDTALPEIRLRRIFNSLWPSLDEKLSGLPAADGPKPEMDEKETLAQILQMLRQRPTTGTTREEGDRSYSRSRALANLRRSFEEFGIDKSLFAKFTDMFDFIRANGHLSGAVTLDDYVYRINEHGNIERVIYD